MVLVCSSAGVVSGVTTVVFETYTMLQDHVN